MKNKSLTIIILQSVLIIGLLWLIIYLGKDKIFRDNYESGLKIDDEYELDDFVYIEKKIITLPNSIIINSGIEIKPITESKKRSLYSSYGYVLNLKNLIDYKTNYLNLNFEINKLNSQLKEENEHYKKLKSLNEDNKNISDSVVHDKEIEINNLQNNLNIKKNNKNNLLQIISQDWGNLFKDLLIHPKKNPLKNIFNSEARLLKITMAIDNAKKLPPSELIVFSLNQPEIKYKANFISKAPIGDSDIQGQSNFYLVLNNDLMIGSKISSYIDLAGDSLIKKFHVPKSAIIWNNGKPWIYEQTSKNSFLRQPLFEMEENLNGWIVQFDKITPKAIVTNGAQLLLSEEYKHLITNENED